MSHSDFPEITLGSEQRIKEQEETASILESQSLEDEIIPVKNSNPSNPQMLDSIQDNTLVTSNPTNHDSYSKEEIDRILADNKKMNLELIKIKQLNNSYLSQIDTYEKSLENNKKIIKEITDSRNKLRDENTVMLERFNKTKKAFEDLKLIALENKKEAEKATNELSETKELKKQYNEVMKQIKKKEEEISNLASLIEEQESQIKELDLYLEKANDLNNEYEGKTSSLLEKVEGLENQLHVIQSSKLEIDEQNTKLLDEMKNELEEVRLRLAEKTLELENKEVSKTLSAERVREIEELVRKNKEKYQALEESLRRREEQYIIKEEQFNAEIKTLQENNETLVEENLSYKTKLEEEQTKFLELQIKFDSLTETYNDNVNELNTSNIEMTSLKMELEGIKTDFEFTHKQLIDEQSINHELKQQIDELRNQYSNFNSLTEENTKLKNELEEVRNNLNVFLSNPMFVGKSLSVSSPIHELELAIKEVASTVTTDNSDKIREELEIALKQVDDYKQSLEDKDVEIIALKEQIKNTPQSGNTDDSVNNAVKLELETVKKRLKSNEETISKLNEENRGLKIDFASYKKQTKSPDFVDDIIKRNFGMTLKELHTKFNEFSVTLEIAEYNLQTMKAFPNVRELVDKKISENQEKLYKLITRPFKG